MKMEHLVFLHSVSFLPYPLRKLPDAFGLTACKSWYPHYFSTEENLDYVGPNPDVTYYGVNVMGEEERREFQACYESQKSEEPIFEYRRVLQIYCQGDESPKTGVPSFQTRIHARRKSRRIRRIYNDRVGM